MKTSDKSDLGGLTFFGLRIENKSTPYILIGFVLLTWSLCWVLISNSIPELSARGQFGDMFGAVNALFSGLAFAGIIYTILLQQKELKETRDEFKQQNATLSIQRFENTFFNMIKVHTQAVNDLYENVTSSKGRHVFRTLVRFFKQTISDALKETGKQTHGNETKIVITEESFKVPILHGSVRHEEYSDYFSQFEASYYSIYNHYLQSLTSLYLLIKNAKGLSEEEKETYFDIFETQITEQELAFFSTTGC